LSVPVVPDPRLVFSAFDLTRRSAIVAAVSGGSDSLALLFLLHRHLQRIAPATRLVAATVDHRLRPEAADEAREVAGVCAQHGIEHRTLCWSEAKPVAGISAAARTARYRLLAEAAQEIGTDLVLTGHTADDQAETVLMRQARGDGRGLAGMAPATLYGGRVWIVRPLIETSRDALRDFLRSCGLAWIEDPTNLRLEYERVRVRSELASAFGTEAKRRSLLDLSRRHAAERIAAGEHAAAVIFGAAQRVAPGLLRLPPEVAAERDHLYAFRILVACAGGAEHLPDKGRTALLMEQRRSGAFRATLSGAVIDGHRSGTFIYREFRGAGPAQVPVRDRVLWDRRYRLRLGTPEPDLTVGPLGREAAAELQLTSHAAPAAALRAALSAEPALHLPGKAPALMPPAAPQDGIAAVPILGPWAEFLPSFDLAPARAMASLVGADPIPNPPFASHNRP